MELKKNVIKHYKLILLIFSFFILRLHQAFILPEIADESIYLYKTYLMTEGWQIYKDFGDIRTPGVFLILYPFIFLYKSIAGPPFENIIFFSRIFAVIASTVSAIFIFKIGGYLKNDRTGYIAVILFLISPYALGFNSYVLLENFLTVFSLIGLYLFISGMEIERKLFAAGVFFGLAVLMKQTAVLLFMVALFMLLVKNLVSPDIKKFFQETSMITSGGVLVALLLSAYLMLQGNLSDFLYAMKVSVQQSQAWVSPSSDTILHNYIMPSINANELVTLVFGFSGLMLILFLFITHKKEYFGVKTIALWFLCYTAVMYKFSYSYGLYYIPMLPPLVIISAFVADFFLDLKARLPGGVFIALIVIILAADVYHLAGQYQEFTPNPMKKITMLTPPVEQQIEIGRYLYEHTLKGDKIFSIDPVYTLVSDRELVNHFMTGKNELPTTEEFVASISDEKVKYVVVDERAKYHIEDKWSGDKITDLYLSMDIKIEDSEDATADGIVIELRHKDNASLWWIHEKNWTVPSNESYFVHYNAKVEAGEWTNLTLNLSDDFKNYFKYLPAEYEFILWANSNDGSTIRFMVDKIVIRDDKEIFLNESFEENSSIKKFQIKTIEGKKKEIKGGTDVGIKNSCLKIQSFNENYGLSTVISHGLMGYIQKNFEKEKDFMITMQKTGPKQTTVSLYKRKL